MRTRLAILDIDGHLGLNFVKSLVKRNVFDDKISHSIFTWYDKYKKGQIKTTFVVDKMYRLYARGLKGKNVKKIDQIAPNIWNNLTGKLYKFTPTLIDLLKKKGFVILLISGSPAEMVKKFGQYLGISGKNVISGEVEIINDVYTGQISSYQGDADQKVVALNTWTKDKGIKIDWSNSISMGNDERDTKIINTPLYVYDAKGEFTTPKN